MIICYIDESGTPDIPGNTSHFILSGLAIPIFKWKEYETKIYEIKKNYSLENAEIHTGWILRPYNQQRSIPNFEKLNYSARRHQVEIKRRIELLSLQNNPRLSKKYHKTKKFYNQTNAYIHLTFDDRKQFIIDIAKKIGSWHKSRLFAECIDKTIFNTSITKQSVSEQSFEQLISRFEQYLQIISKVQGYKTYGLLVHDNNFTVNKKLTELMKQFHNSGTFWTDINNIIETPMFVDSELTGMIQLADVCSYSIRRYLENNETYLFKHIIKRADRKDGKIVGVRHFGNNTCNCYICSNH